MKRVVDFVFIFILLGAQILGATPSFSIPSTPTPPDALLSSFEDVPSFPIVRKLLQFTQPSTIERGKIEFILTRIRKSELIFIRNGEMYPGKQAAMHLTRKYRKRIENIRSVHQFIDDVASASATTGEPYYIIFPDGNAYRSRDIFHNELRQLEEYLAENRS